MAPPKVQSVAVNGGAVQRSSVRNVTVTFTSVVDLPTMPGDAFLLTRTGPGPNLGAVTIAGVDTSASTGTQTIATLTFSGALTLGGSLIDGRYDLKVLAARVSALGVPLDGNGDGTGGDDYGPYQFHRFFGDSDGNGMINGGDFLQFRLAFQQTNSTFSYDGATYEIQGAQSATGAPVTDASGNYIATLVS